jgi:hypothetical protein
MYVCLCVGVVDGDEEETDEEATQQTVVAPLPKIPKKNAKKGMTLHF